MGTVAVAPDDTLWGQLTRLRPRLRGSTQVKRHVYRGAPWYVLRNPLTGRHYRVDESSWNLLGALDGQQTLGAIVALLEETGVKLPDREEFAYVVARLRSAGLLDLKLRPDTAALLDQAARQRRTQWLSLALRPFSMRIPLMNPDRLLQWLTPMTGWLFGPVGVVMWLCAVLIGMTLLAENWQALTEHATTRMGDPLNLFALFATYPALKLIHELGHGVATRRHGGEVPELGVVLLVFVPVPYVDASAASGFPSSAARMMVGAAGILVESTLAALGLMVWAMVEPGLVRDIAFNVILIGGVSSLAFNGNPLMRFDAYYVLADAVEIPGLAVRANAYWSYLVRRYLLGVANCRSPVTGAGERPWFLAYAPLAFAYRIFMTIAIASMLLEAVPAVGAMLAIWAIFGMLGWPLLRQIFYLCADAELHGRRTRALLGAGVVASALVFVVARVPFPSHTGATGIVRQSEASMVRAGTDGFVVAVDAAHGATVTGGQPLFRLDAPELAAEQQSLRAKLSELEAHHERERVFNRASAGILIDEIAKVQSELTEISETARRLAVRSPAHGRLSMASTTDWEGRYVKQGDLMAHVVNQDRTVVRVAVPQSRIDLVRADTRTTRIRLAHAPEAEFVGRIVDDVPAATRSLPSALLGSLGGGDIAVDARDPDGTTSLEPVFQLDIEVLNPPDSPFRGGKAWVRFEHGDQPLAVQLARAARVLLLARTVD